MKDLQRLNNPYCDDKVLCSCAIFGMMDSTGKVFSGEPVFRAMINMQERGNGLGAGFALYGIYPEHQDYYALHIMFTNRDCRHDTERFLETAFQVERSEEVPTRKTAGISGEPLVYRYFVRPKPQGTNFVNDDDFVVQSSLKINSELDGAFVVSSGKNMGVFKGVGYPEQIAEYFRLDDYKAYIWTAHSRFPTNSQAWWGGAHPFCMLDWSVVHNGELSSYGANRAFLETIGYKCTLFTDTEVMSYAVDLIMRRQKLPPEIFAKIVAPPLWEEIDRMSEDEKELHTALRSVYGGLLMNGPFSVVIANNNQMIALTDRIRLRPLTAATRGNFLYFSSEEASIRLVSPELDNVWTPMGGMPVVGKIGSLPKPDDSRKRNTSAARPMAEVAR
ncbi:MAG: glutamine amidotransferase family protein [Armatimonadetes bacterium]|nr:glutamine amidotransferase family protein [Armatimonadota bacterium]